LEDSRWAGRPADRGMGVQLYVCMYVCVIKIREVMFMVSVSRLDLQIYCNVCTVNTNRNELGFWKIHIVIYDSKISVWCFQAEELIKREMITMLHYDAVYSPPVIPAETKKRGPVTSQAQHLVYLEQHPYKSYTQDQLAQV
jgi:hypothetical protein